ncbi:MAG: hypothetical protein H6713_27565 [Myxococcales bacterium]|nr:hypothetical protein [Myxococcales bacterium]MCB9753717.1 hypothetical protein [Myxococcales bacterium]
MPFHGSKFRGALAFFALFAVVGCGDADPVDSETDGELDDEELRKHKGLAKQVRQLAAQQGITPMPAAPEIREELVELGRALAFDKELSGNRDISCMTCHPATAGTDDDLNLAIGVGGVGSAEGRSHPDNIFIPRNAPPLFNMHDLDTTFWDGRVNVHGGVFDTPASEQLTQEMIDVFEFGAPAALAMFPVTSRAEMRGFIGENDLSLIQDSDFTAIWEALMGRLGQIPEYVDMFEAAYPGTAFEDMSFAHAANAIAGFEISTFEAANSPWDEMLRGDDMAMSSAALRGAKHFLGDGGCSSCHSGSSFTDEQFHNTALPQFGPGKNNGATVTDDWGRYNESDDPADFYRFRTAPLRNIELTAPYGHAGQFVELEDFVRHYLDPETSLNNYDPTQIHPALQPSVLPTQEAVLRHLDPVLENPTFKEQRVDEVMAFLAALTDPDSLDLSDSIPESVPSGLPVHDNDQVIPENRAGTLTMELGLPGSLFREYQVQTPEMCAGGGSLDFIFDRNANTFIIDGTIEGLPYRPTYCYDYNPGTPYNSFPDCVSDGRWQLWLVPRVFNRIWTFYYDGATGELLGHEHDVDLDNLPPTAFPLQLPGVQQIGSPYFESDPDTLVANIHFEFDYDAILDRIDSAGAAFAVLPYNLNEPDVLGTYYTEGGLPVDLAVSFDDFILQNAEERGPFALAMSYEPLVKPDYLRGRDNTMLGFSGFWPVPLPEDSILIPPPEECGTNFQWPYPGAGLEPAPVP